MMKAYNVLTERKRKRSLLEFKEKRPWRDPNEDPSSFDGADAETDDDIKDDEDDDEDQNKDGSFRRGLTRAWITRSPFSQVFPLSFQSELPVWPVTV